MITSDAWAQAPSIVKQATVRASLTQVAGLVNRAARAGGFERPNSHLSRSPMVLDKEGWDQLAGSFDRLLKECEEIAAASAKRLASEGHEGGIPTAAVLMLFETTPAAGAAKPSARARARRKRTPAPAVH